MEDLKIEVQLIPLFFTLPHPYRQRIYNLQNYGNILEEKCPFLCDMHQGSVYDLQDFVNGSSDPLKMLLI